MKQLIDLVGSVAPTIATALGGPLAGMATKVVSEALLGKPRDLYDLVDDVQGSTVAPRKQAYADAYAAAIPMQTPEAAVINRYVRTNIPVRILQDVNEDLRLAGGERLMIKFRRDPANKINIVLDSSLTVEFDFVAAEDGSKHTVITVGEAMDSGDKASNKAMSAAYKYAAFQAFCIPTEGDNDADSQTHEVAAATTDPIVESAVQLANTIEELNGIWKGLSANERKVHLSLFSEKKSKLASA